jgi:uncharacterized membrane protein YhhN
VSELSLAAFVTLAVVDWTAVAQGRKRVEYIAKPAALAALLVYATAGANPSGWLITALVLSLLGDVYLMLPAELFVAGLTAFLLAHAAYIIDFRAAASARITWFVLIIAFSSPLVLRIVRSVADSTLRPAVLVYAATIALMVASAFASGSAVAATGAVLFFVSDGIIAWNRFVKPVPRAQLLIMVTYHLGQFALVTALRSG